MEVPTIRTPRGLRGTGLAGRAARLDHGPSERGLGPPPASPHGGTSALLAGTKAKRTERTDICSGDPDSRARAGGPRGFGGEKPQRTPRAAGQRWPAGTDPVSGNPGPGASRRVQPRGNARLAVGGVTSQVRCRVVLFRREAGLVHTCHPAENACTVTTTGERRATGRPVPPSLTVAAENAQAHLPVGSRRHRRYTAQALGCFKYACSTFLCKRSNLLRASVYLPFNVHFQGTPKRDPRSEHSTFARPVLRVTLTR